MTKHGLVDKIRSCREFKFHPDDAGWTPALDAMGAPALAHALDALLPPHQDEEIAALLVSRVLEPATWLLVTRTELVRAIVHQDARGVATVTVERWPLRAIRLVVRASYFRDALAGVDLEGLPFEIGAGQFSSSPEQRLRFAVAVSVGAAREGADGATR